MPSSWQRTAQKAEVNWVPWSEVSWAGTQYLDIQPAMSVSAQVAAVMSGIGIGQCIQPAGGSVLNGEQIPAAAGGRWQGAHNFQVDVCELSGWDGHCLCSKYPAGITQGGQQAKIAKGRTGNKVNRKMPSTQQHPTNHRNNNLHGKGKSGSGRNRQKIIDRVTKKVNIVVM
jgi:hypothetical protein